MRVLKLSSTSEQ